MAEKEVSHKWKVKTKGNNGFAEATLDNVVMDSHFVGGAGPNTAIDLEKMQEDFDNHPGIGVVKVNMPDPKPKGPKGPPYLYCLPLRDGNGRIIMYTCGGIGPYQCSQ